MWSSCYQYLKLKSHLSHSGDMQHGTSSQHMAVSGSECPNPNPQYTLDSSSSRAKSKQRPNVRRYRSHSCRDNQVSYLNPLLPKWKQPSSASSNIWQHSSVRCSFTSATADQRQMAPVMALIRLARMPPRDKVLCIRKFSSVRTRVTLRFQDMVPRDFVK